MGLTDDRCKELKTRYALDMVPTSNPQVIEAMIWIARVVVIKGKISYGTRYELGNWARENMFSILFSSRNGILKRSEIIFD